MTQSSATKKSARDRMKMALIPVLAVILGFILFRADEEESVTSPAELATQAVTSVATPTSPGKARSWAPLRLEDATAFNPFDPPAVVVPEQPEPAAVLPATGPPAANIAEPEPPRDAPPPVRVAKIGQLQAVYQDSQGAVAIVASKIVRVGDLLDGCRILEITPEGIVVESPSPEIPEPEKQEAKPAP